MRVCVSGYVSQPVYFSVICHTLPLAWSKAKWCLCACMICVHVQYCRSDEVCWGLLLGLVSVHSITQTLTCSCQWLQRLTSQTAQNAKMTNQPAVMVGEIGQLDDKERKRAIRGNPWVYGPIRIDETIKLASGSTVNYESWMDRNTLNANFYFQCLDFIYLFIFLEGGSKPPRELQYTCL